MSYRPCDDLSSIYFQILFWLIFYWASCASSASHSDLWRSHTPPPPSSPKRTRQTSLTHIIIKSECSLIVLSIYFNDNTTVTIATHGALYRIILSLFQLVALRAVRWRHWTDPPPIVNARVFSRTNDFQLFYGVTI